MIVETWLLTFFPRFPDSANPMREYPSFRSLCNNHGYDLPGPVRWHQSLGLISVFCQSLLSSLNISEYLFPYQYLNFWAVESHFSFEIITDGFFSFYVLLVYWCYEWSTVVAWLIVGAFTTMTKQHTRGRHLLPRSYLYTSPFHRNLSFLCQYCQSIFLGESIFITWRIEHIWFVF